MNTQSFAMLINGEDAAVNKTTGIFATIDRHSTPGDTIELKLPMDVTLMKKNPRIEEVRNQTAVKVGPSVYCIESPDLPEGASALDVCVPSDIQFCKECDPGLLGGATTLMREVLMKSDERDTMYRPLGVPHWKIASVRFVPYYAWSNRGESEMTVWLPVVWKT